MYIFTTLEFSTHNLDFHLLTTSVNANIIIIPPRLLQALISAQGEPARRLGKIGQVDAAVRQTWASDWFKFQSTSDD